MLLKNWGDQISVGEVVVVEVVGGKEGGVGGTEDARVPSYQGSSPPEARAQLQAPGRIRASPMGYCLIPRVSSLIYCV